MMSVMKINFWKKQKNNTVYWAYDNQRMTYFQGLGLCMFEPVPVLNHYYKNKETDILFCPAFRAALQNTYAILSPIDIRIRYTRSDRQNKKMELEIPPRLTREQQQSLLVPRFGHTGEHGNEIFSIFFIPYLFYTDHSMIMEILPPFLEWNNRNNARVISGSYDIGKWKRLIEYAVELRDADGIFEIKRGEPLLYVRFNLPSPLKHVYLKPTELTPKLREEMAMNVNLKRVLPNQTLETCYELRNAYNRLFK